MHATTSYSSSLMVQSILSPPFEPTHRSPHAISQYLAKMPEHHQLFRRFSFLQCVIIFWHLHTPQLVKEHDTWLRRNLDPLRPKRTSGTQGEADLYKGWFFWMFLNRLNSGEMMDRFKTQGWSPSHNDRWFGNRLTAWGWNRHGRPGLLEDFHEFLWKIFEGSGFDLRPDAPEMFHYINVLGWTLLPPGGVNHEASFSQLERQANALLDGKQSSKTLVTSPLSGLAGASCQGPESSPSLVGHQYLERRSRTSAEPSNITDMRSPHSTSPDTASYPPRHGMAEKKNDGFSIAVSRSDRRAKASQNTNHQQIPSSPVAHSRLAARTSIPATITKDHSILPGLTSRSEKSPGKRTKSSYSGHDLSSSDYHHDLSQPKASKFPAFVSPFDQGSPHNATFLSTMNAGQSSSTGTSRKHPYGAESPPSPPKFCNEINDINHQPLGLNVPARTQKMAARTETKHIKIRAPNCSPPYPTEELLKHQRRRIISPMTSRSKLSQKPQPQKDRDHGALQMASTPKRQRMGAFGSPSLDSSIASSPTMSSSVEPGSSQTSITSNTTLPPSLEGSPPYSHQSLRGKKRSSRDIDTDSDEFRSSKRLSVMSPGSVVEAVKGRLADEIDHRRPEPFTSNRHASPVHVPPSRQALPTPDKAAESKHVDVIRDAASDPSEVLQVDEADTTNTLPKSSKSISNWGSDRSHIEEEDQIDSDYDWFFLEADANNDHIYGSFGRFDC